MLRALEETEEVAAGFSRHYLIPARFPSKSLKRTLGAGVIHELWIDLARLRIYFGRRLAVFSRDSIFAISNRRLHLAALALRALVEISGALVYYEERIGKLLTAGVSTQSQMNDLTSLLNTALNGGRADWEPYVLGGKAMEDHLEKYAQAERDGDEPTSRTRQKSSAAFVAAIEKAFRRWRPSAAGGVRAIYAMLSDICHPALGGELILTEIPQPKGWIATRAEAHDLIVQDFTHRLALPILHDLPYVTTPVLEGFRAMADSLQSSDSGGRKTRIPPEAAKSQL